jgi:DNA polymerase-3 subunit delta'
MARARVVDAETEAPPEADGLEGWPHPRHTPSVVGQAEAERVVTDAIGSGRMHHAWLMTGTEGIGKATFAYRLARFLLAQDQQLPSGVTDLTIPTDSTAHRQVSNLSHPGLLVVRRAWDRQAKRLKQNIAIDDIRALRHFLQRTAVTPWRVVVVDTADDLNLNSANALLKSLEEPPKRTIFLLISSSPGRLLPTIRSRCRTLRFEALGETELKAAVGAACAATDRDEPGDDQVAALQGLAKGSVRRVLQLLDGGGLHLLETVVTLLESLPRLDRQALHKLIAQTAGRDTLSHDIAFDILEGAIADTLRAAASGTCHVPAFPQLRRFPRLLSPESLADWAELWETMREARNETERLNLDKAALVVTAFERIERLSRKTANAAS